MGSVGLSKRLLGVPTLVVAGVLLAGGAPAAQAIPILQIYIEGAQYDNSGNEQTWILSPEGQTLGEPFRLWVIGNTSEGDVIKDVRLAATYDASLGDLIFDISPSKTNGVGGFDDDSIPDEPVGQNDWFYEKPWSIYKHHDGEYRDGIYYGNEGSIPLMGKGVELPTHGQFGDGIAWQEFYLGTFDETDSQLADFNGNTGVQKHEWKKAQINVYDITIYMPDGVTPAEGITVHFDVYGKSWKNGYVKAPFSHDGAVTTIPAPQPGLAAAGLCGLLAIGVTHRRRRAQQDASSELIQPVQA